MAIRRESIETEGGGIPVFWATGDGARLPGMLIVPSIFGVAADLEEQAEAIAGHGAIAVIFDPFWRVRSERAIPYEDFQAAMACLGELDREAVYADMKTVLAWMRAMDNASGRVAGLGICFGGPFCLLAAADKLIDGVVTWHGSRMHNWVDRADEMTCPMRLHFGGDDPFVPMDQVNVVRDALGHRDGVDIVIHPGASHGFSHGGPAYQEAAASAGMEAARDMLKLIEAV